MKKIGLNLFIRAYHLQKIDEQYDDNYSTSWEEWVEIVKNWARNEAYRGVVIRRMDCANTEKGYAGFRTQIKEEVEIASKPTAGKTF